MKVFDIDNPVWSTCSKVLDVMILNFFFIICCIPIITIPASFTALYYTAMRFVSGNITYVYKDFFDSFKSNFKQGFLVGVLVFDAGVILAVLTYISFMANSYLGKVVFVVLDVFYAASLTYTFPILAKFTVETKELFRNSVIMAVANLPFTFLNLGVLFICTVPAYYTLPAKVVMLVFGCSLAAIIQSIWFNYIFKKYLDSETLKNNEIYKEEEKLAKKEKKMSEDSISVRARKR
ncbi:MAG: DUF624 domain-containing protein [Lachnospiraceae bacterium]|nr:DUF624 domain-containing protein [Lachnospiraceae bacterium]